MIKLILSVDNELVDKDDLIRALHANDAYLCIDAFIGKLRGMDKWGTLNNKELNESQQELAELIQEEFFNIIKDLPGKF